MKNRLLPAGVSQTTWRMRGLEPSKAACDDARAELPAEVPALKAQGWRLPLPDI